MWSRELYGIGVGGWDARAGSASSPPYGGAMGASQGSGAGGVPGMYDRPGGGGSDGGTGTWRLP